ncbi:McrC family protein [Actinopolyspora mortivallis]|uniref:Restriction endonuclease n=1 Tax=Actinopolyspora mortivallis TaxID=33906 RepID=A0A2T0H209_ACTMO|nr:restriction endonuclease [Actinopolyspora mortivallis]PRW65367.1 restriction endonuclease [Actinopolyspora mortivallis]
MINLSLTENAPARTVSLPEAVGRALAHSGIVDASPHPDRAGYWQLRAAGVIGTARITTDDDTVVVHITPKVPIARVLFLLEYRRSCRIWLDETVPATDERDLLAVVARLYAARAEHAVRQGLMHGYRETDETTHVMRGRLRHSDQLRAHHGRPLPLEVTHDEHTTDITENRLLASATRALLRIPTELPEDVRLRLLHLRRRFSEITPLPRGQRLPNWQHSRLNARYHHALRLAELVLRGSSVEHRPGHLAVHGFLVDTAKLFEDFVTVALRNALAEEPGHSVLQEHGHLDENHAIPLTPDFVHYAPSGEPRAVVDVKYKAERPSGYPNADLYQMLAYCVAFGLRAGHLVYAKGNSAHGTHRVRRAGITIHQHALELDQPPPQLLDDVDLLARRLTERS